MPNQKTFLFLFLSLFLTACQSNEAEERLKQREQELLKREKEFALKEADYQSLVKMRDSLSVMKFVEMPGQWPARVDGNWNSKVVCTETSCSDYVIGDQKANVWVFFQDSTGLYARVLNNTDQRVIRVYNGRMANQEIHLDYGSDSGTADFFQTNVVLNSIDSNLIKGVQTISKPNGPNATCIAKCSVELIRKLN